MSETSRETKLPPIGMIRSTVKTRAQGPKQGQEGAPDAWLEVNESVAEGLDGLARGDELIFVRVQREAAGQRVSMIFRQK